MLDLDQRTAGAVDRPDVVPRRPGGIRGGFDLAEVDAVAEHVAARPEDQDPGVLLRGIAQRLLEPLALIDSGGAVVEGDGHLSDQTCAPVADVIWRSEERRVGK